MTPYLILHWLQRTTLEGSLLLAAMFALRAALGGRLAPGWRVGLWALVAAKLLVPACVPAGFGLGSMWQPEPISAAGNAIDAFPAALAETPTFAVQAGERAASFSAGWPVSQALIMLWLAGALVVLGAALVRQRGFERRLSRLPWATDPELAALVTRLAAQARVAAPRVLLCPQGTTPALVGTRRPCILLPADWRTRLDERSLRHVLLHELLHIRHHDLLWNWAGLALQALHWFNPLVWAANARFQADRELRCDAGAVALLSPVERIDYGRTLLRIQEGFSAAPAIAGLAPCVRKHPALRQRILMIASPTRSHPAHQALLALAVSLLAGWSFTTAHAVEKEVPPKVREGASRKTDLTDRTDPLPKGPKMPEKDGQPRRPGPRDEEGMKKPGMRDGERPRSGPRDGEGMKQPGDRDGGGREKREGMRDGAGRAKGEDSRSGEVITLRVIQGGDSVLIDGLEIPMNRLRGHLSRILPAHPGAKVQVTGEGDIPLKVLHNAVDAVRDNGNRNVSIATD